MESDLHSAATTSARRARPRCRSWRSPSRTRWRTCSSAVGRGARGRQRSRRGCRSSSPRTATCSRRRQVPRGAPALGAHLMRERFGANDDELPPALPHADRRRHAHGAAAAQQRRACRPCRRWRRCSAARNRCTRTATTRRWRSRPPRRPRSHCARSRWSAYRERRGGTPRIRWRAASTWSSSRTSWKARAVELLDEGRRIGRRREGDRGRILPGGDRAQRVRASAARGGAARRWWLASTSSATTSRLR